MVGALIADGFASAVIEGLVDTASSLLGKEGHLRPEMKDMLIKLQSTLRAIRAWIDDAEGGLTRDPSQAILLRQLKNALYDAKDVLDELQFEILSETMDGNNQVHGISCYPVKFRNSVSFHHNLQNLKNLLGNLERICHDATHNLVLVASSEKERTKVREAFSSIEPELEMERIVGREKEREMIVKNLLSSDGEPESRDKGWVGSSTNPVFNVLPLVGMGGAGKTTLAKLVYNDETVRYHFGPRLWCHVSDNFDIKRILKSLCCSLLDDLSANISDIEAVIMELKLALSDKKFLIVFDDVWVEEPTVWEMLCNIFTDGARGCKVVVTTRSQTVAHIVGIMRPIMVNLLSENECWDLFKHSAFGDSEAEYKKREKLLRPIGMQICKKLGGLPLAAKVLGDLLSTNLDDNYWRAILERELWEQDFVSENILSILKLSYQHLNANLRQCFAYCSIFPRGYMFKKHKLVQMWLAHGFIKLDEQTGMTPEDIGSRWFDELKHQFFFEPAEGSSYVMHDLMRALAISVALDDCFVADDESENIPQRVRHLAVRTDKLDVLKKMRKFKSLHTFLLFGDYGSHGLSKVLEDMFMHMKGLRVLDLSSTAINIKKLPDTLGGLPHLRYLDISHTKIRLLPASFSRLHRLQVLNLQGCHFEDFPKGMNKLINLRYLYGDSEIVYLIKGFGKLTNLRNLEEFPVRQKKGHEIGGLKNLNNLQGRLSIKNLENVQTREEAMKAGLENKIHLDALLLEWSALTRNKPDVGKEVLEGLQPHPNLEELSIIGYDGVVYPDWMAWNQLNQCLVNLVHIHLKSCLSWKELPSFGQLPLLRILHFENMPALTRIGDQFYGNVDVVFPSLEELKFLELKNLEEWSGIDRQQFFPCLRKIQVIDCRSLTKCPFLSLRSSVEELIIDRCGDLGMALPGCLQSFTSLTLLKISHYHHKTSLTLSNLIALEELCLQGCPELSIQDGQKFLVTLKKLQIEGCPKLRMSLQLEETDTEEHFQKNNKERGIRSEEGILASPSQHRTRPGLVNQSGP